VTNTRACYITHTNERTHEIIRKNLHRSAMYNGNIHGIGPRYCPSIEDKIGRFAGKTSHHVFVEPEGASTEEIYPNGISTSLPYEVQKEYVQTIVGFENAVIVRPGYAIEYDFALPDQLSHTLEVKTLPGLFFAGQINGTTGYEEAAGQGIVAGINAHLLAHKQPPFILDRNESYIGVMIDDLVSLGVDEPYRMFTSRAERRLTLRQDNAFLRLTDRAYKLGLIDASLYHSFKQEQELIESTLADLRAGKNNTQLLTLFGEQVLPPDLVRQHTSPDLSDRATATVHAEIRYAPYIERERKDTERMKQQQKLLLPDDIVYTDMPGLSKELQTKLERHRPATIAQASLIQGMTPAALSLLIGKIKTNAFKKSSDRSSCTSE
jgi:tRNA uridine 5-carboxymethylaminomethyl modification enzyme